MKDNPIIYTPEMAEDGGYLLPSTPFKSKEEEIKRNHLTDVRLAKVGNYLFGTKFKYDQWIDFPTPLLSDIEEAQATKIFEFDELPDKTRHAVFVAETLMSIDYQFEEFLKTRDWQPWEWASIEEEERLALISTFRITNL